MPEKRIFGIVNIKSWLCVRLAARLPRRENQSAPAAGSTAEYHGGGWRNRRLAPKA